MIDLTKLSVGPVTGTEIITIGVVATLTTDLWQRLVQAIGLPPANWGLVGRWVAGFSRGIFIHRPITATPKVVFAVALLIAPWFVMQPGRMHGHVDRADRGRIRSTGRHETEAEGRLARSQSVGHSTTP